MNRRNRGQVKRMEFEPKVPQESVSLFKGTDIPLEGRSEKHSHGEELAQQLRGMLAPRGFSSPADFDIGSHQFILSLPDAFEDCSLLVFKDGTLGIRMDGIVYECDSSFIGDGIVVEIGDAVRKLDGCDFILTAYNYEKK